MQNILNLFHLNERQQNYAYTFLKFVMMLQ